MAWLLVIALASVLVLAILGLGVIEFFSGVYRGYQTIQGNPLVNATVSQVRDYIQTQITNSAG